MFACLRAFGFVISRLTWKLALQLLCTHPAYHRRGLAAALLEDVLALADAESVTVYLDALDNAVPVYQRYGFTTVDQLEFDRTKAGLEGTAVVDIMIRRPRSEQ